MKNAASAKVAHTNVVAITKIFMMRSSCVYDWGRTCEIRLLTETNDDCPPAFRASKLDHDFPKSGDRKYP
jgi:hypothetical protein